jgi:hypothetical protein
MLTELLAIRGKKTVAIYDIRQQRYFGQSDDEEDEGIADEKDASMKDVLMSDEEGHSNTGSNGHLHTKHQPQSWLKANKVDLLKFYDGTRCITFNPHIHGEAIIATSRMLFRWDEAQSNAG